MLPFPFIRQVGMMECGPTCLAMILKHYGYHNITRSIVQLCETNLDGTSLQEISQVAESFGFKTEAYELDDDKYLHEITLPCIAHYEGYHFVVIYKVDKNNVWVADPAFGKVKYTKSEFKKHWNGIVLLIEPQPAMGPNKDLEELLVENKRKEKSLFAKYYRPVMVNNRRTIFRVLLANVLLQLLMLGLPFLTQAIIDQVLTNKNYRLLIGILAAMVLIFATQVGITYIRNIFLLKLRLDFEYDFFSKFFRHFVSLTQPYYDRTKREDFINRFQQNVQIRELANPMLLQGVMDFALSVLYLPFFFLYDARLAFMASGFILLYVLIVVWFTPRIFSLMNHVFYKNMVALGKFLDTLLGIQTVKLLSLEQLKYDEWRREYRYTLNSAMAAEHQTLNLVALQRAIFFFSQICVFWWGAYMVFNNTLTIGQYVSFTAIFMLVMGNMNNFGLVWVIVTNISVSLNKINHIFLQDTEDSDPLTKTGSINTDTVSFQQVNFKYHPAQELPVLNQFSLDIKAGEKLGIVGRNGAGKTTFAKLMLGLYQDFEGKLLLGNTDIRQLNPHHVRKRIFLFPQQVYIFQGTIKENIAYGNPGASMEQIMEAAKLADLHDFIKSQYLGYNQVIGEFGSGLSGGQILKLGFCRLFLSNPDIIILDEASSMLDLETERKILQNLQRHFSEKTIISIAHRLHTLRNSDRLIVIEQGQVAEQGTHEHLMAANGIYAQLMSQYVNY